MRTKFPCVYMLASRKDGAIYIGVTSNLIKRTWDHKNEFVASHTHDYHIHNLVWYELHETMDSAIKREKALKKWNRDWKISLINKKNPGWNDLFAEIAF